MCCVCVLCVLCVLCVCFVCVNVVCVLCVCVVCVCVCMCVCAGRTGMMVAALLVHSGQYGGAKVCIPSSPQTIQSPDYPNDP